VICIDIDVNKVKKLSSGQITIYEPGLEKIFLRNIKENRLTFSTNLEKSIEDAEIIFLALPTPPDADGSADLKHVLGVANQLGNILDGYKVIVNKSTVPVGTADKVKAIIAMNNKGDFDVVSNPVFLKEGVAVDDFMKPDRVVVGTKSEKAKK
jgi:UDPglucose 6-dehydrogenase